MDPRFRSHTGQEDRIEIFRLGAAKLRKKSWRETFGTTGVKFLSEILSPGEKFGNLTQLIPSQKLIPGSGRTLVNSPKIWKFDPVGHTSKWIPGSGRRPVKKTESKFSTVGQPNCVKNSEGNFRYHWHQVPERNTLSR